MLMVTTTVGVVNGVHGNTTSTGPADWDRSSEKKTDRERVRDKLVSLGLEFVVGPASLEQGLVNPPTASDDTDSSTGTTRDCLFCTRWETDTGLVVLGRVSDDGSVGAGCPSERTTVTDLLLDAANDRSFRELAHRENISNVKGSLLAAVDEGASMKTFGGNEGLLAELVAVWIAEDHTGKRSTTASSTNFSNSFSSDVQQAVPARVVNDFLDDTANVAIPFGKVEGT